jgi:hypothetical protein
MMKGSVTSTDVYMGVDGGNVGIGTANPGDKLDVNGSIRAQGWDAVLHSLDTSGRYYDLIGNYQGWDPAGIYIAGYNAFNASGRATQRVYIGGPGTNVALCLSGDCRSSWPSAADTLQTVTDRGWWTSQPLYTSNYMQAPIFYDANESGYYVDPNGDSQLNKLDVGGNTRLCSGNAGGCSTWFSDDARMIDDNDGNIRLNMTYGGNLRISNGGLVSDGSVGIGIASPGYKLHVSGGYISVTEAEPGAGTLRLGGLNNNPGIWSDTNGKNFLIGSNQQVRISAGGNYNDITKNLIVDTTGNVGIGTANPGAKLDIAGQIKISDGTQSAGKVLTSDDNGLASWQTSTSGSGGIPPGAVMFFNLSSCPSGWSSFSAANGRYVVGGNIGTSVGQALGNGENRATGTHIHRIPTLSSWWHNHTGTTGLSGSSNVCTSYQTSYIHYTGGSQMSSVVSSVNCGYTSGHSHSIPNQAPPGVVFTDDGVSTIGGTNAPYIQLLPCVKD